MTRTWPSRAQLRRRPHRESSAPTIRSALLRPCIGPAQQPQRPREGIQAQFRPLVLGLHGCREAASVGVATSRKPKQHAPRLAPSPSTTPSAALAALAVTWSHGSFASRAAGALHPATPMPRQCARNRQPSRRIGLVAGRRPTSAAAGNWPRSWPLDAPMVGPVLADNVSAADDSLTALEASGWWARTSNVSGISSRVCSFTSRSNLRAVWSRSCARADSQARFRNPRPEFLKSSAVGTPVMTSSLQGSRLWRSVVVATLLGCWRCRRADDVTEPLVDACQHLFDRVEALPWPNAACCVGWLGPRRVLALEHHFSGEFQVPPLQFQEGQAGHLACFRRQVVAGEREATPALQF